MKIDKSLIKILLKIFLKINPAIYLYKGNVVTTKSPAGTVLANAFLQENEISHPFGIRDLRIFTSVVGSMPNPEIEFDDDNQRAIVKSDHRTVELIGTPKQFLAGVPVDYKERDNIPDMLPLCNISKEDFSAISGVSGYLAFDKITFASNGKKLKIVASQKGKFAHEKITLEYKPKSSNIFKMKFSVANLFMMNESYNLYLVPGIACIFRNEESTLEYWLMNEGEIE